MPSPWVPDAVIAKQTAPRAPPAAMPTSTSCPDFEEHCANRQSAATEYFEMPYDSETDDHEAVTALRHQLESAEQLIHLLHIEIDDRREIHELDTEKIWFLSDAITANLKRYDDMLMYSEIIRQFLERHRELARAREKKKADSAKWKARRDAVLDFCGLTSFVPDVKKRMGKERTEHEDEDEDPDEHDVKIKKEDTSDDQDARIDKEKNTRTDSGIFTNDNEPSSHSASDPARLVAKPLILKGPITKPVLTFSGSGGSDEYDIALQVIKKNTIHINYHRGVLAEKLSDLQAGKWQVGFRQDLSKRGVLPFPPA